MLYSKP